MKNIKQLFTCILFSLFLLVSTQSFAQQRDSTGTVTTETTNQDHHDWGWLGLLGLAGLLGLRKNNPTVHHNQYSGTNPSTGSNPNRTI